MRSSSIPHATAPSLLVRFLLSVWPPYTQAAFRAFSQRSCCASYRSFSQATA